MDKEVDLNTATSEELVSLPGIGPDKAWDIMHHRPFHGWSNVARLPGFDEQMVETIKRAGGVIRFQQDTSL
jgi:DNA uptake protein ComE-like DNA-binding protein